MSERPGDEPSESGLWVDPTLRDFLTQEVLPGVQVDADAFFAGLAEALHTLGPRNEMLLQRRAALQAAIDEWHAIHGGAGEPGAYRDFLEEIGYLVPPNEPFTITTAGVDEEIHSVCGPQLVVPVTNARYALNAMNARWGSLYDALYGTDALGDPPAPGPYDQARGDRVIAWVRDFLDEVVPLAHRLARRRHRLPDRPTVDSSPCSRAASPPVCAIPELLAGHMGDPAAPIRDPAGPPWSRHRAADRSRAHGGPGRSGGGRRRRPGVGDHHDRRLRGLGGLRRRVRQGGRLPQPPRADDRRAHRGRSTREAPRSSGDSPTTAP